jgi:putative hemolysin
MQQDKTTNGTPDTAIDNPDVPNMDTPPTLVASPQPKANKTFLYVAVGLVVLIALAIAYAMTSNNNTTSTKTSNTTTVGGREDQALAKMNATDLTKKAEVYYSMNGTYPKTLADFENTAESSLAAADYTPQTAKPTSGTNPEYVYCSDTGAQIVYYDAVKKDIGIMAAGDASSSVICK